MVWPQFYSWTTMFSQQCLNIPSRISFIQAVMPYTYLLRTHYISDWLYVDPMSGIEIYISSTVLMEPVGGTSLNQIIPGKDNSMCTCP